MNLNKNNVRYFNRIEIVNGTHVYKSYIGNEQHFRIKFYNEILWMNEAQKLIPNFVPKLNQYSLDPNDLWLMYEYIPYKTVHDVLLYEDFKEKDDLIFWKKFIKQSKKMYKIFSKIKPDNFNSNEWKENIFSFSIKRTFNALNKLELNEKFRSFFENDFILINNKKYPSLKVIRNFLYKKIIELSQNDSQKNKNDVFWRLINSKTKKRICLTHLDLVFGNIFFDLNKKELKLIDPRGSYVENDKLYGDVYYDCAKYFQSIFGLYDYIVEDRFQIGYNINKTVFEYNIQQPKNYEQIKNIFCNFFKKIDFELIKLIESFQFFTMIPAHLDNYSRQLIEIIIGITHFYEVVGENVWK